MGELICEKKNRKERKKNYLCGLIIKEGGSSESGAAVEIRRKKRCGGE